MIEKKLGIINATPFYQDKYGSCYLAPYELKSLEMFTFFRSIVLYKTRIELENIPSGWILVPDYFKCKEICTTSSIFIKRKKDVQLNIRKYLDDVDIFYFRMPSYESSWAWEIIRKTKAPFFTELHGDWEESINNEDGNSLVRRLTRKYRAKKATDIVKKMTDDSLFVMTIGHKLTRYIKDKDKPTLVTTNHLVDQESYVKLDKKILNNRTFKILFVGDVQVRKGLLYLFKAFKMLINEKLNVQLDIVGSGASESMLKEYTKNQELNDRVVFHGRIPHGPMLFDFFKKASVFVLPSVGAEGVPRVIHEAMAMSCPVIGTDVGSVAWQLENSSGILISPGNEKSIYDAIKILIENPVEYQKIVKNGYQRSLDFTYEKQKSSIQKFITSKVNG
jgi:glycosyltransferase involved in cell wall biosynthesis